MSIGTLNYDNLLAGSQKPPVIRPGTVELSQLFSRGALCGHLTGSGLWEEANHAETGNYEGYGVACEGVDSTLGTVVTSFFVEGEFAENAVTFFYGDAADDWRELLASRGIYLRKTISVVGQ